MNLAGNVTVRTVKRFQDYLAEKFDHDIEKLNKAWWTTFWSHTYNDFSQIEPPYRNGEFSIMGLNLEWKRFTTEYDGLHEGRDCHFKRTYPADSGDNELYEGI